MKSTIKEKAQEIKYPCLMRCRSSGVVVLFVSDTRGFMVNDPEYKHHLGEYGNDWKGYGVWEYFTGQIILENN